MNKAFLIGNLTRDPEKRETPGGKTVCNFTLAVNRRAGGEHPEADYFRVTAWGALGDICAQYLRKGRKCSVAGPVELESYTDRDGAVRYHLAVKAEDVEFLTPRQQDRDGQGDGGQ